MKEFLKVYFIENYFAVSLQFEVAGIVFGEVRANLNDQYIYPVQFSRLICRRRKRNKAGVLQRVIAIVIAKSIFEQSFSHLYNLINLELCLVKYEPISMTTIIIRCSSPGLFAGGVKEIRRVYCTGLYNKVLFYGVGIYLRNFP